MKLPAQNNYTGLRRVQKTASFSLAELLLVVAVMTILMTVSLPSLTSLAFGGHFNHAVSEVNGILEQARQYALAQNTYVWVAFNSDTFNGVDMLSVAVVYSKDGTDPGSPPFTNPLTSNSSIQLVNRIRTFQQIVLHDIPTATNSLSSTVLFSTKIPGLVASSSSFTRSIQFTPGGEARVVNNPVNIIEFGLQPKRTSSTIGDTNNVAIVRVTGITGRVQIDRPQ